jgi:hypothetical protein
MDPVQQSPAKMAEEESPTKTSDVDESYQNNNFLSPKEKTSKIDVAENDKSVEEVKKGE